MSSSNNVFTIQINEFQFVGSLFLVLYFWFHNQKQWSVPFLEETLLPPNLKSFWINQSSCKSLNFLDTTPDITACDHCITTTIVTFFWACPFFFLRATRSIYKEILPSFKRYNCQNFQVVLKAVDSLRIYALEVGKPVSFLVNLLLQ